MKSQDVYPIPAGDGKLHDFDCGQRPGRMFDVVLPDPMPGKGPSRSRLDSWISSETQLVPDHLLSTNPADLPGLSEENGLSRGTHHDWTRGQSRSH